MVAAAALLLVLDLEEHRSLQAVVHMGLKKSLVVPAGLTGCRDSPPEEEGVERCLLQACHSAVAVMLAPAYICWMAVLLQVVHCKVKQFAAPH